MEFPHEIFRDYDIRGVVDAALTEEVVAQIGYVIAREAIENSDASRQEFMVGRDGRLSGGRLSKNLINGLRDGGADVVDIGCVPTPVLYFTANARGGNGVVITGSHNPPEYNGLKIMISGVTLSADAIQKIKRRVIAAGFAKQPRGRENKFDALYEYKKAVVSDINLKRALKIIVDCGNGVGGVIAPQLFRDIGCEVVELFSEVDGNFPNHHPDPSQPHNLRDLIKAVDEHNADLGLAFDGDADRLGVVSSDGDIIWPDRQMILFAQDILTRQRGGEIIFDVKCSQLLPRAISKAGGVATMCKTGHSFIKQKLTATGAALAGEMSGHLFFNDRWGGFDDGIYAGARLCELLAGDARPPNEIFAALPNSVNTPEILLKMNEGEPQTLVADLISGAQFDDANITTLDGLRVDFADGFGLVRASNTTPAISMRFEASDTVRLKNIQKMFRDLFSKIRPDLDLPF